MSCCGGVPLMKKMDILEDASPLGAYLSHEELERLASLCDVLAFKKDQELPESPFYCIYTGLVEVKDGDTVLCTKYPGAFFTRRAGLVRGRSKKRNSIKGDGGSPKPVSAEGTEKAHRTSIVKDFGDDIDMDDADEVPKTQIIGTQAGKVLYMSADNLDKFLFVCKPESADIVKQITRTNIGTQLSNVPFIEQCPDLEPTDLRALGEICSYKTFDAKEIIFAQGDAAEWFYIILKGKVEITIDTQALRGTGEKVSAGTRNVGDSFGVAALVYNAAERKYSTTALERTLCLTISRENFGKFLGQKPSLEDTLMKGTKSFLLQRYAAMNVPIFSELSQESLMEAASLAKFKKFNQGDVVYRQGDPPSAFYVVLDGEVTMTSVPDAKDLGEESSIPNSSSRNNDGSLVKETNSIAAHLSGGSTRTLTVGMHFGEVGVLLPSTPCIATCECTKRCTLLALETTHFLQLFGADTNLLAEMQIKLLRTHATLRSVLSHKRSRPLFEAHIKSEYADESIKFFDAAASCLATAGLKGALEGDSRTGIMMMAKKLVDEYIVDGADSQVNIPGGMQKAIEAADKAGDAATLFEKMKDAQAEIYLLMARDNYPRFVKSKEFEDLLKEIGSYGDEVKDLVSEKDLTMLVQDGEGDAANSA